ncbi:transcription initiation factor TFIID subunit 1-like [Poeciliopsis prolifica]|uniref:transcription initiation factor TFIID subunit 1-like n=1 Tax=Poeciliopsis prolifica TaxID=188132 RepID=UPI002413C22A|nr:transcription initiation factor TFIID subunit 1-like [Poeciliopsis prolifica]
MITARETQTSLFVMLMLYLTAAAGQTHYSAVRVGDEITLSCENVNIRNHCDSITWMFGSNRTTSILFENGKIHEDAAAKSDKLRITSKCSLIIKEVSDEDVGLYIFRRFINEQEQDFNIILSVIHMVEQKQEDKIILTCSVTDLIHYRHTVEWLNEGREETFSHMQRSDQFCSATVTIPASDRNWKENLKCKVTNDYSNKVQLFDFRIQSFGGKTAKTTTTTRPPRTTTTRKSTTTKMTATKLPATTTTTTESLNKLTSMAINSSTNVNNFSKTPGWSMFYIICPAVIIVTVLLIIGWKKTRKNRQKICF